MPIRKKTPAQKPSGALKRLLDTKKVETRVVGPVERMLMARDPSEGRRQDVLHPSELAKTDHCPLADYYRLTRIEDGKELPAKTSHRFRTEVIFSEGHEYHRKWQSWVAEVGQLEGVWECPGCTHRWWDTAPLCCPRCNHVGQKQLGQRTNMIYREVPLKSAKHRISGHADGKVGTGLLEVKSIGEGTIRIEAPTLYGKHTKKVQVLDEDGHPVGEPRSWVDIDGLWDGIKRPFPSHLRQADIYMGVARASGIDIDHMVFIYESKAKGGTKEFVVAYDQKRSDALLEVCLDIVWAVEKRRPPACPHQGCANCRAYEEDTTDADPQDTEVSEGGGVVPLVGRTRAARGAGVGAAGEARGGLARLARRPDGAA